MKRKVTAAFRLARGIIQSQRITAETLLVAPATALHEQRIKLVSFDVFETLLTRTEPGGARVRAIVASTAARYTARQHGTLGVDSPDARALRSKTELELRNELQRRGLDPEVAHREVLKAFLRLLAGAPPDDETVESLCTYELALERYFTRPDKSAVALVGALRKAGYRVIAVSDMYFAAHELVALLGSHGVELDAVYSSSDLHLSKFTGRLFSYVSKHEAVTPPEILHVGDSVLGDVISARAAGVNAIHWKATRAPRDQVPKIQDASFDLGYRILGPAIVAAAELLLRRSEVAGVDELAFLARDAELLHQVVDILLAGAPRLFRPGTRYVHLSRRAVAAAGVEQLTPADVRDILAARATNRGFATILDAFNLDRRPFIERLCELSVTDHERPIDDPDSDPILQRVLGDERLQELFSQQRRSHLGLLRRYLQQEGLLGAAHRVALVDVGWRGTTQSSLERAVGDDADYAVIRGYYVGLWDDGITRPPDNLNRKEGLLSDFRRGRTIVEGSAWYLAFVLEAISRASHGTVLGFEETSGGVVKPVHAAASRSRSAEEADERIRTPIRAGILAFATDRAGKIEQLAMDDVATRKRVQRSLARLAFFPTATEVAILGGLAHTEAFAQAWQTRLVHQHSSGVSLLNPRQWLSGLQSPWRAGFIRHSGGYPLASVFALAESLILLLPPAVRRKLRDFVLRIAATR